MRERRAEVTVYNILKGWIAKVETLCDFRSYNLGIIIAFFFGISSAKCVSCR